MPNAEVYEKWEIDEEDQDVDFIYLYEPDEEDGNCLENFDEIYSEEKIYKEVDNDKQEDNNAQEDNDNHNNNNNNNYNNDQYLKDVAEL